MAGPYPLATLAAQVNEAGISAPTYADVLASLQASYQSIFGSDAVLDPSSQDGQWIAIIASAVNDANATAIAVFNAFSPASAQGGGLSSVVKINGIARLVASNSTADLTIVGQAGTLIAAGIVGDGFGNQWALPAHVTIPGGGSIVETAVCTVAGALTAAPGTITNILNPTRGWQSATNAAEATVGAPVESDATLRRRQSFSTALPALSVLDAIVGQIANLAGVETWAAYENDADLVDANGIPGHTISLVVEGGDSVQIATVIADVKTPGTGTFGTTSEFIIDPKGVPNTIKFFRPTVVRIIATVTLTPLTGYVSTTGDALVAALADYVSGGAIGQDVIWSKLFVPANLGNAPLSATYDISSITVGIFGGGRASADVPIAFNAIASLAVADIVLNV